MTNPYSQITALVVLAVIALVMTSAQLVSITRDTNTWVIVRSMTRDRFDRFRRGVQSRRG